VCNVCKYAVQLYGKMRRVVMLSGLPVITFKTKKACGQRLSAGAAGGYYTAAGMCILIGWVGKPRVSGPQPFICPPKTKKALN